MVLAASPWSKRKQTKQSASCRQCSVKIQRRVTKFQSSNRTRPLKQSNRNFGQISWKTYCYFGRHWRNVHANRHPNWRSICTTFPMVYWQWCATVSIHQIDFRFNLLTILCNFCLKQMRRGQRRDISKSTEPYKVLFLYGWLHPVLRLSWKCQRDCIWSKELSESRWFPPHKIPVKPSTGSSVYYSRRPRGAQEWNKSPRTKMEPWKKYISHDIPRRIP